MNTVQLTIRGLIGLTAILCPFLCMARETFDLGVTYEIQGKVPDMQQQIESSGLSFRVELRDIEYSGKVHRTVIEPTASDRMTVWLALEKAVLTIQRTEVDGRRHSAQCGPMELVLGNQRELWIAFEVERKIEAGAQTLALLRTRVELPRDNWSIGSPSWVKTSGFGMTQDKVISGLRNGLAKRTDSLERQLIRVAPAIFAQVEDQIAEDLSGKESVLTVAGNQDVSATETSLQAELVGGPNQE